MDKLWKKEHNDDDACFVNLFYSEIHEQNFIINLKRNIRDVEVNDQSKNNEISSHFRDEGNKVFKKQQYQDAMEFYNLSLRFAEMETDNMSKAYANRSACFLHMQKYDECLIDINLAKNANYPPQLMRRLTERETDCMEKLKEKPHKNQAMREWKLSYPAKERFPGMANVLEVRYNDEYGRHIVATEDIDVGKTVLMEDAYLFGEDQEINYSFCDTCAKGENNLIPCPNCISVMFCNNECMGNNITHKLECGSKSEKNIIMQSILIAISTFDSNIEELMEFVGNVLADKTSNLPEQPIDHRSKYRFFLKSVALPEIHIEDLTIDFYKMIMAMNKIGILFDSMQKQRFLMHLILQHIRIIHTNSIQSVASDNRSIDKLHSILSLLNHSCIPNLIILDEKMKSIAIIIRPIMKDEQLFFTYRSEMMQMNTNERQKILIENYNFKCKCSKCLPCSEFQTENIILNLTYRELQDYFLLLKKPTPRKFSSNDEQALYKKICCQFLNKLGHLPWSEPIENVMFRFMLCLCKEQQ